MIGKRARTFVIVGNGIAGVTAAEIVRAEDAAAQSALKQGEEK